jgi:hypothetical protein
MDLRPAADSPELIAAEPLIRATPARHALGPWARYLVESSDPYESVQAVREPRPTNLNVSPGDGSMSSR